MRGLGVNPDCLGFKGAGPLQRARNRSFTAMRYPPIRRRRKPPLPIDLRLVPGGVEIDFGPLLHQVEMDELMRGLAIRWQSITGK